MTKTTEVVEIDYLNTFKPELKSLAAEGDDAAQTELDRRKAKRANRNA